ncbi:hypothetical protein SAMN05661086_03374 [Anaeromicropila populeti]|uniref:Uncharacterized protein n=1 Tax=Anaeromicropila populeti TaxID=37658 RepID=A0A1I6LL40_9FIRM|nr:hypothetical protein SAMN05661086_03374 [Anaeromicropila populeti]
MAIFIIQHHNDKLEFLTRHESHKDLFEGTITLDGDCATVTFYGDDWCNFDNTNTYQYHKTSDIPYDHYFE